MNRTMTSIAIAAICAVFVRTPCASAHAELDAPNGGETGTAGTIMTVEWHVTIEHVLEGWELWYSTESADGPWTLIDDAIPAGDPAPDVPHTYQWTLPDLADDSVWVRVVQVTNGPSYDDVSDGPFSIEQGSSADVNGDGTVDVSDLTQVIIDWGACMNACAADVNGDGAVDVVDLIAVILAWT